MSLEKVIQDIRQFIDDYTRERKNVIEFTLKSNPSQFFASIGIDVNLNEHKAIILQEDTLLELGGVNHASFSLIYPIEGQDLIQNEKMTLIGRELDSLDSYTSLNFGILILIQCSHVSKQECEQLRETTFLSNGIEGFMIRTIPRRFWCRISKNIASHFSFEFLANAINNLYSEKFGNVKKNIEIIMLNESKEIIDEFNQLINPLRSRLNRNWKKKVEEWKKRLDCDYDWECQECPYIETCDEIRDILDKRSEIEQDN